MKRLLPLAILLFACTPPGPYRVTNFFFDSDAYAGIRPQRVAVLGFDNSTYHPGAGASLADEFSIQLGKLGRFDLVERLQVEQLFKEQDIDPKRLDPATAVKLGKMLGAHAVFLGTVEAYRPGKVGLAVRMVSVETGRQVWQASDVIHGYDGRVRVLVDPADRYKLDRDKDFLARVLCKLLLETLRTG